MTSAISLKMYFWILNEQVCVCVCVCVYTYVRKNTHTQTTPACVFKKENYLNYSKK